MAPPPKETKRVTRSSIAQHETSGKTTNNGSAAKRKADTPLAKPDAAKKQATSANKRDSTKKKEKTTAPKENASKGSTKIIAAKSAPAEEKADASTSKGSTNDAAKKHVTFSLQLPKLIKGTGNVDTVTAPQEFIDFSHSSGDSAYMPNAIERYHGLKELRLKDIRGLDEKDVPMLIFSEQIKELDGFFKDLGFPDVKKESPKLSTSNLYNKTKGQELSWRRSDYEDIWAKKRDMDKLQTAKLFSALCSIWEYLNDIRILHAYSDVHPGLQKALFDIYNGQLKAIRNLAKRYFKVGGNEKEQLKKRVQEHIVPAAGGLQKLYSEYCVLRRKVIEVAKP